MIALTGKIIVRGHEVGAENWALLASIVATCKLNSVNPAAYLTKSLLHNPRDGQQANSVNFKLAKLRAFQQRNLCRRFKQNSIDCIKFDPSRAQVS